MRPHPASRRPVRALAGAVAVLVAVAGAAPVGPAAGAGTTIPAEPLVPADARGPDRVVVGLEPGAVVAASPAWTSAGPDIWLVPGQGDPAATAAALARAPGVAWAEPDAWVQAAARPDDPLLDRQAHLAEVGASVAWDVTTGDPGVVVAVLDTGVDATHPDLLDKLVGSGDFVTLQCADGRASAAHGTVVAGLVGAATDNGLGVAGLGWRVGVLALRVLCDNGTGSVADVAGAMRVAVDAGVEVINLSLTGATASRVIEEAVTYATDRGVLVVAAAGNSGSTTPVYPAALPGVFSVAASVGGGLAGFSNRGSWVDLAAPGVDLFSTVPGGGYGGGWSGTSFSAPLVAATAALLRAQFPEITAAGVADRLARTAQPLVAPTGAVRWGRLDTGSALQGGRSGLWWLDATGGVVPLGDAAGWGTLTGVATAAPLRGMAATPSGRGYWLVAADGGVFAFGDAPFLGSTGGVVLRSPVVGMAATPSGRGYWLVAADGGVFAFGDAPFLGSTGGVVLRSPVVGMAATPSGRGYWLVAADGGVFSFGDAPFVGSLGGAPLNGAIVGMAARPTGAGYWLVGADGGVFTFGDAPFGGSAAGATTAAVGLVVAPGGSGYWVVTTDGTTLALGSAPVVHPATGPSQVPVVGVTGLVAVP